MNAIDLFGGPGGWDEGIQPLGIRPLGVEWDDAACATRRAAGHRTLQADVAALDPLEFAPCELLLGSPPCQSFSLAGKREGHEDVPLILEGAKALARGEDRRAELLERCRDPRSLLVLEPLRWAIALEPTFVAFEQVPDVFELWQFFADLLRWRGYHTWAGILSAEQYGVPQTRRRAFLLASREGGVSPPAPTHQAYEAGVPAGEQHTLEGVLLPWVSMAEALGWDKVDGVSQRRNSGPGAKRDPRPSSSPPGYRGGKAEYERGYVTRQFSGVRAVDDTGDRLLGVEWPALRPATTLQCDPRVFPGPRTERNSGYEAGGPPESQGQNAIRVTVQEAAVLQGFRPDYPFQGTQGKVFEQVGNAVPPPLARAVMGALTGAERLERAA